MAEETPAEINSEEPGPAAILEPALDGEAVEQHKVGEEGAEEEELDEEDEGEEDEEEEEAEEDEQNVVAEDKKTTEVVEEFEVEEEGEEEGEAEEEGTVYQAEEEEEEEEEEGPPDPSAPYDFSDSKEALKAPFELNTLQMAEVEAVWNLYLDCTPAYADLDNFVTEIELEYLLKCLLVSTFTAAQMQELITFCVRRPDADGTINFEEFVKMVTIRQRDIPIEEELRLAVEVLDPKKTGIIDREFLRETLTTRGYQMNPKSVDNFVKEVDMSNDGTIGVEDIVGTICLDLARDDIITLQNQINPPEVYDEHIAENLLGSAYNAENKPPEENNPTE